MFLTYWGVASNFKAKDEAEITFQLFCHEDGKKWKVQSSAKIWLIIKNVKNAILTNNPTHFKEIDKKLLNICLEWLRILCSLLDNDVILFYVILKS